MMEKTADRHAAKPLSGLAKPTMKNYDNLFLPAENFEESKDFTQKFWG
jgi:hypothetical protein